MAPSLKLYLCLGGDDDDATAAAEDVEEVRACVRQGRISVTALRLD